MSTGQPADVNSPLRTSQAVLGGLLIGAGSVIGLAGCAVVSSALAATLRAEQATA